MQLTVQHRSEGIVSLPINYHHILQAIIFSGLKDDPVYGNFLHDGGYYREKRQFKMFTFSELRGKYENSGNQIIFKNNVSFEVRSPDVHFIRTLNQGLIENGIRYGHQDPVYCRTVLSDYCVESEEIYIKMLTPICVYSTDSCTKKTYFYSPDEVFFFDQVAENFLRKYQAYYGVVPDDAIELIPVEVMKRDKCVTNYKGFYISGWRGIYQLRGRRKYLDFLYQTGVGSKNSQGFGMFTVL